MLEQKQIHHCYIPNEIFTDLKNSLDISTQRAFAYSYNYYINYLYRYCKWIDDEGGIITQERIKEKLGYAPNNKKINFIIKKNGILDNLGYTETTNEYPIRYYYDDDFIIFQTNKDLEAELPSSNLRNTKIKKPIRAFHIDSESVKNGILNGTFYSVERTHRVNHSVFEHMMNTKELGTVAFYIYSYIKRLNDVFTDGLQRSYELICKDLGFSEKTVIKYVNELENYGYMSIDRGVFDLETEEEDREANKYYTLK